MLAHLVLSLTILVFNTASNGNTLTISGDLYESNATDVKGNTLTFGNGGTVAATGGITDSVGTSTLNFSGGKTVNSAIGTTGNHFATANLNGATGNIVNLNTSSFINNVHFNNSSANSTLALANATTLTGAVTTGTNNTGTLNFGTGSNLTGAAGATNLALNQVNFNGTSGTATIGGALTTNNVNFGANSTGTVSGVSNIGSITATTTNTGTLNLNGNSNITGTVGTSTARLGTLGYTTSGTNTLTLGGATNYVNNLTVGGAAAGSGLTLAQNAAVNVNNAFTGGNHTYIFTAGNAASTVGGITSATSTSNLSASTVNLNTSAVTSAVGNRTRYLLAQNGDGSAESLAGSFNATANPTGVTFRQVLNSSAGNGVNDRLEAVAVQTNLLYECRRSRYQR